MRRHLSIVVLPPVLVFYLAAGAAGLYRYIDNYWLYRGFGPPRDPAFVKERGTTEQISVTSAALGGRTQTDRRRCDAAHECAADRGRRGRLR
jgi:hypothetical protein